MSENNVCSSSADRRSPQPEERVICRICLSLMICPVTLPCGHDLCLSCFKRSTDLVSLLCPFCRLRISCWARKAKNDNQLIDWKKWNKIQEKFPELVAIKASNAESLDLLDEELFESDFIPRDLATDGEIRKEFEELSQKEKQRLLDEEMASQKVIEQILAEDQRSEQMRAKIAEETANDELIARALQQMEDNGVSVRTLRNRTFLSN